MTILAPVVLERGTDSPERPSADFLGHFHPCSWTRAKTILAKVVLDARRGCARRIFFADFLCFFSFLDHYPEQRRYNLKLFWSRGVDALKGDISQIFLVSSHSLLMDLCKDDISPSCFRSAECLRSDLSSSFS
jgi:hypothetical protein